jgi:hypothetical protein
VRILDQDNDKSVNSVIVYLTSAEASELRDSLDQILAGPAGRHEHVSSRDYSREITVCVYEVGNLERRPPKSFSKCNG